MCPLGWKALLPFPPFETFCIFSKLCSNLLPSPGLFQHLWQEVTSGLLCPRGTWLISFSAVNRIGRAFYYSFICMCLSSPNVHSCQARLILISSSWPPGEMGTVPFIWHAFHGVCFYVNWAIGSIFQLWSLYHPKSLTKLEAHSTPFFWKNFSMGMLFLKNHFCGANFCSIVV